MRVSLKPGFVHRLQALFVAPLMLIALQACAQEADEGAVAESAAANTAAPAVVSANIPDEYANLANVLPGITITGIRPSPIDGLLEISVGTEVYYVTADGKYFLQAEVLDLETKENITEDARTMARAGLVQNFEEATAVSFKADEEVYRVLVFTDIDCPYCRKLHREIAAYNEQGISVDYLFFPRSGPGTDSWAKADAVWCSESRQGAMTAAKGGEVVEASEACTDTPTAAHYQLGRDLGVTGTPAIVTQSGGLIVGYRPAAELRKLLDGNDEG